MEKITRRERLRLLGNGGFYKCGYLFKDKTVEFMNDPETVTRLLTDDLEAKVRSMNDLHCVKSERSSYFTDEEGCVYDYKGRTYKYGNFLMHVYTDHEGAFTTTAISLLHNTEEN